MPPHAAAVPGAPEDGRLPLFATVLPQSGHSNTQLGAQGMGQKDGEMGSFLSGEP